MPVTRKRLALALLVALLSVVAISAASAEKKDKIRVYVFTATAAPNEFINPDEHPRSDSVKDLRTWLRDSMNITLVESRDDAEVTIEVIGRERLATGGVTGSAVPTLGGPTLLNTMPTTKAVVYVRLSVVGKNYSIDGVGLGGLWSRAAAGVGKQIERWVKENYERLRPAKQPE